MRLFQWEEELIDDVQTLLNSFYLLERVDDQWRWEGCSLGTCKVRAAYKVVEKDIMEDYVIWLQGVLVWFYYEDYVIWLQAGCSV
jgi:hypothetical protein